MSEATSKQWRPYFSNNMPTMDALVPTAKNKGLEITILMPDNAPYSYRLYEFYGEEVPDGTLYPDSVAPIGSRYYRLTLTDGVVTACMPYIKTSANTWQEIGDIT